MEGLYLARYISLQVIQLLDRGYRLEQPPKCPKYVYDLMIKCWSAQASKRPTFEQLYTSFSSDPAFSRAKSIIGQQKTRKGKFKLATGRHWTRVVGLEVGVLDFRF